MKLPLSVFAPAVLLNFASMKSVAQIVSPTESPSVSPSSFNMTLAYGITAKSAKTNSDNSRSQRDPPLPGSSMIDSDTQASGSSVDIIYLVGRLINDLDDIDILPYEPDCETEITTGFGEVISGRSLSQISNSETTLSLNIDTRKIVASNLFLVGDSVEGTIGWCLRATSYETLTFIDGNSSQVAMFSQRTKIALSYSGSDQGIALNDIVMEEQAVIDETIDDALSDLTLSTYLCSSDSVDAGDVSSVQVDSVFVCISPSSDSTFVSLKVLTASYGPSQATTMTLISTDDNFDIGLTTTEVLSVGNKNILRIQIPVLLAFLEGGNTVLNVGGFADVGFEQQNRHTNKNIGNVVTIAYNMQANIGTQVEESGCLGLIKNFLQ